MRAAIRRWDWWIVVTLGARRRPLVTRALLAFTWSGAAGVWFALAGLLYLSFRMGWPLAPRPLDLLRFMTVSLTAVLVGGIVKRVVRRPRPYRGERGVVRGVWTPGPEHSFPSTHAASSVALAVAASLGGHPWAQAFAAWACIVSFSRLYLGVHFPSDVLAGGLLGAACALLHAAL